MRALVIATGVIDHRTALGVSNRPLELTPFLDRPVVQHAIESLTTNGITHFDIVLHNQPETFESLLGTGARWGVTIAYHLVRSEDLPYTPLRFLPSMDEPILMLHADRLPLYSVADIRPSSGARGPAVLMIDSRGDGGRALRREWTGCAWLPRETVVEFPCDSTTLEASTWLHGAAIEHGTVHVARDMVSLTQAQMYLAAQQTVLEQDAPLLISAGVTQRHGIRLGRGVSIHPSAEVIPPVYIGECTRICRGATIGPNASVGPDCIIEPNTVVANGAVLPGTLVGQGLEVRDAIVDSTSILNARLDTGTPVPDALLLTSVATSTIHQKADDLFSRVAAMLLFTTCLPLLFVTGLYVALTRPGPLFFRREIVRTPVGSADRDFSTTWIWSFCPDWGTTNPTTKPGWRDLLMRILPGLCSVIRGDLAFVGLEPRSVRSFQAMPEERRHLYVSTRRGLVTEERVTCDGASSSDDVFMAEAYQAATASRRSTFRYLAKYLYRTIGLTSTGHKRTQAPGTVPFTKRS